MFFKLVFVCLLSVTLAQDYQDYQQHRPAPVRLVPGNGPVENKPTPVPILKQINKHNEDGSYTYGYEGADGSFKIETKLATGEVKGKYGYVDETGKVRVVDYGANKYGFQPSGEGITVAPPTLVDETTDKNGQRIPDYVDEDDQQPQQPQYQPPQYQPARPQPQPPQKQYIARIPRPQTKPQKQFIQYEQPQPQQYSAQSPTPQRAQISNAVPIDVVYSARQRQSRPEPSEYSSSQTFFPETQEIREVEEQEQQLHFNPSSRSSFSAPPKPVQQFQPQQYQPQQKQPQQIQYSAPRAAPLPQQQQQLVHSYSEPQQQFVAPAGRSTSVLDQLAKDYALPQGGSPPLHDITFSYY